MSEKLLANNNAELLNHAKVMRREMTDAEQRLWHYLRAGRLNGYKFRRQQPMGRYIVDFVCVTPKLIVEADGGQHAEQAEYDEERSQYLHGLGFTVLRFWNDEILRQTDDVLAQILSVLQALARPPEK
ncbi:endonuclease domain-containing protein [Uruburuella testudinis]|uniref:Endonuclease domain-containing protein n=1 Tax=Uruburuella testudinis TaxID=1282863 RepID=A0ABY4DRR0_9NEIS|nr:endonuclease domain-containing protein [Uruburuella testudinis]UOO81700.1 endonuclease domain-containing protein [Uruburuella testudinis]